jgi:adenylate kinase
MNIVLLGAPGAGKGTQAESLIKKYGLYHISTGNIFREEMKKQSEIGMEVEGYVKSGKLVPDELTVQILFNKLTSEKGAQGFLFDGFPRTVNQADIFDKRLAKENLDLTAVVYLQLSDGAAVTRLSNRRQCKSCGRIYNIVSQPPKQDNACDADGGELFQRDDDKTETILQRMSVFSNQTRPLIDYYTRAKKLVTVNGDAEVPAVTQDIFKVLDQVKK